MTVTSREVFAFFALFVVFVLPERDSHCGVEL